jgi:hypothetical protein
VSYSPEHQARAEARLLDEFRKLLGVGFGKLTVNVNLHARKIEVIPEPHFYILESETKTAA